MRRLSQQCSVFQPFRLAKNLRTVCAIIQKQRSIQPDNLKTPTFKLSYCKLPTVKRSQLYPCNSFCASTVLIYWISAASRRTLVEKHCIRDTGGPKACRLSSALNPVKHCRQSSNIFHPNHTGSHFQSVGSPIKQRHTLPTLKSLAAKLTKDGGRDFSMNGRQVTSKS